MSDEKPTAEELAAKAKREAQTAEINLKAKTENDKRSGQGTRLLVGSTRGRSTFSFTYEAFDESLPDTLPKTTAESMVLMDIDDSDAGEAKMVNYLIKGFNLVNETAGADPVSEYVDLTWPEDFQKRFKLVIKNYAENGNVSIEDAVSLLKPGMQMGYEAQKAAAKAITDVVTA